MSIPNNSRQKSCLFNHQRRCPDSRLLRQIRPPLVEEPDIEFEVACREVLPGPNFRIGDIPSMDTDASIQASRKKPPTGKLIVVALLATHRLFLIIIVFIAFFRGLVGVSHVAICQATPEALVAVLWAGLALSLLFVVCVSF